MHTRPCNIAALSLLALAGCAASSTTGRDPEPTTAAREPGWTWVHGVPGVRQSGETDCGAASLGTVLDYWGSPTPQAALRSTGRASARELKDLARARGYQAYVVEASMDDLRVELQHGRPVIVGTAGPAGRGHYEVIVGLQPDNQVMAWDPARGWQQEDWYAFQSAWAASGRVALLVSR